MLFTPFFKLIRWKNICIILLSICICRCFVLPQFNTTPLSSLFEYFLFCLGTISTAAGGYIINDYFDIRTDAINKPKQTYIPKYFSKKTALLLYVATTLIGISAGIYLGLSSANHNITIAFLTIAFLLFLYSYKLKSIPFLGNFVVAVIVSSTLIVYAIFDIYQLENQKSTAIIISFSIFSFFTNLIREIVKDLEDMNGDYTANINTLPTVLGRKTSKIIIWFFSLIMTYLLLSYTFHKQNPSITQTAVLLIIISLYLYFKFKLIKINNQRGFNFLSKLLKAILVLGLLLLIIISIEHAY